MSSKSEEDMKPVPFGSLLLKATLAYLVLSLMSILLFLSEKFSNCVFSFNFQLTLHGSHGGIG